jgi:hypothetical protein
MSVPSRCEAGWIVSEAIWLVCPNVAAVLEGCEAVEGPQPLGEVASIQEGGEVLPELLVLKFGYCLTVASLRVRFIPLDLKNLACVGGPGP